MTSNGERDDINLKPQQSAEENSEPNEEYEDIAHLHSEILGNNNVNNCDQQAFKTNVKATSSQGKFDQALIKDYMGINFTKVHQLSNI